MNLLCLCQQHMLLQLPVCAGWERLQGCVACLQSLFRQTKHTAT